MSPLWRLPFIGFVGMPLGTGLAPTYTRRKITVSEGDRILLFTDRLLEAASPSGVEFGTASLERVLSGHEGGCGGLVEHLLAALRTHAASDQFSHDDVTIFAAEFVTGPAGPALWHVFKNRLGFGRPRAGRS